MWLYSVTTQILKGENGGGGLSQNVRMLWDRGTGLRMPKIKWYDFLTLPQMLNNNYGAQKPWIRAFRFGEGVGKVYK